MTGRIFAFLGAAAFALSQATEAPTIKLEDAIARARQYAGQIQGATSAVLQAREDTLQARANRKPTLNAFNQFIYTEGNGTPSGVFVANDGVHVYNSQAVVHAELFSLARRAEYRRAIAAQTAARARQDITSRVLVASGVQC